MCVVDVCEVFGRAHILLVGAGAIVRVRASVRWCCDGSGGVWWKDEGGEGGRA